jgi:hypothetical protein
MKWELWLSESQSSYSMIPVSGTDDEALARRHLEPDAKIIFTVDAETWDEAAQARNDFLGWGPYVPYQP